MIRLAEREDFAAIAAALSEKDRRALMARVPDATPAGPLMRLADSEPIAAAFTHEGKPVAVAGAYINTPRTASAFMFSTDDVAPVRDEVLRFFKETLLPTLAATGVRRVHYVGPANDEETGGNLRREFGAFKEQELVGLGRNGESYVVHAVPLPLPRQFSEEGRANV